MVRGNTVQIQIRCEEEEHLIKMLSRLQVVKLLAMFYNYGAKNSLIGAATGAVLIVSRGSDNVSRK